MNPSRSHAAPKPACLTVQCGCVLSQAVGRAQQRATASSSPHQKSVINMYNGSESGLLEVLSSISNDARSRMDNSMDIGPRICKVMAKVADVLPHRRCVVIHERIARTTHRGFVYHSFGLEHGLQQLHDSSPLHEVVHIERYLRCFATSDVHDYGLRWRGNGHLPDSLTPIGRQLALHLCEGEGIAAHVHSRAAEGVSSLVQLDGVQAPVSRATILLLSFIGFCLHSHFMQHAVHPQMQKQFLGVNLTPKEIDVLSWVVEGKTSWEIGKILETSERTVKFHLRNVYEKLNVTNRAQAVAVVNQLNLI